MTKRKRSGSLSSVSVVSDDAEIQEAILEEEEEKLKTALWISTHRKYLEKQKARAAGASSVKRGETKKNKSRRSSVSSGVVANEEPEKQEFEDLSSSAAYATVSALRREKRWSEKIDYEKWEEMYKVEVPNF